MLKEGESYLVFEKDESFPECECSKLINEGNNLLVTRDNPQKVQKCTSKISKNIWLTDVITDLPHIKPKEIEQLFYDIEVFMKNNKGSAVFFTGIEYLISYNSFKSVLHLIQSLRDLASLNDVKFIVCVGNRTLNEQEENLLRQELKTIGDIDASN